MAGSWPVGHSLYSIAVTSKCSLHAKLEQGMSDCPVSFICWLTAGVWGCVEDVEGTTMCGSDSSSPGRVGQDRKSGVRQLWFVCSCVCVCVDACVCHLNVAHFSTCTQYLLMYMSVCTYSCSVFLCNHVAHKLCVYFNVHSYALSALVLWSTYTCLSCTQYMSHNICIYCVQKGGLKVL